MSVYFDNQVYFDALKALPTGELARIAAQFPPPAPPAAGAPQAAHMAFYKALATREASYKNAVVAAYTALLRIAQQNYAAAASGGGAVTPAGAPVGVGMIGPPAFAASGANPTYATAGSNSSALAAVALQAAAAANSPVIVYGGPAEIKLRVRGGVTLTDPSFRTLVAGAIANTQGSSGTSILPSAAGAALSANVSNVSAGVGAAPGMAVWGWRIRLNVSALNDRKQSIQIDQGIIRNNGGTIEIDSTNPDALQLSFYVVPQRGAQLLDIWMLAVSDAGGQYAQQPGTHGQVLTVGTSTTRPGVIVYSAADANLFCEIHSLTLRDLASRGASAPPASIEATVRDLENAAHAGAIARTGFFMGMHDAA